MKESGPMFTCALGQGQRSGTRRMPCLIMGIVTNDMSYGFKPSEVLDRLGTDREQFPNQYDSGDEKVNRGPLMISR